MRDKIRRTALLLLTVIGLGSLVSQAATGLSQRDMAELAHYTLTMKNITQFLQISADLMVLTAAHSKLSSTINANPAYYGLTAADRRIAAHPEIVAIMTRHGFTPHEFNLFVTTWFSSTDSPPAPTSTNSDKLATCYVNSANIAFKEQHKAEIEALVERTIVH